MKRTKLDNQGIFRVEKVVKMVSILSQNSISSTEGAFTSVMDYSDGSKVA